MSKNRRKAAKEQKQSTDVPVNIVLPDSMSVEELQQTVKCFRDSVRVEVE